MAKMEEGLWVSAALTAVRSPRTGQAVCMALDWKTHIGFKFDVSKF